MPGRKTMLRFAVIVIFMISESGFAQAPVNDGCTQATLIQLTPFAASCSTTIKVNTQDATKSSPNPSCTSSLNDDDVWYTFQASTSSIALRVFNATYNSTGKNAQIGFSLYEAFCPSTTNNIICSNLITAGVGYLIINDLIPGTIYYLRFWSSSPTLFATFEFCAQELTQPENDDCDNAISITPEPAGSACDATYNASTVGATRSSIDPSCGDFNDDDIWYSFIANTNAVRINFSNARQVTTTTSGIANLGYALYDEACPSSSATMGCNENIGNGAGSELVGGLAVGHTYFLRFYSYGQNIFISFDFCVEEINLPVNDECTKAIMVPVSEGFCTSPVAGDLLNATTSQGFGAPACFANSSSEDVWFTIVVPSSGDVTIQTSPVNTRISDLIMEAYSGSCGSLSLITCNDDGNPGTLPSDLHSRIVLNGRFPGEIIYIRVLGKYQYNFGAFAVCAWDQSMLPEVSPGGHCMQGNNIIVDSANLNRYMWVPLLDKSGKIVAEINADGNNLGEINSSLFLNTSGQVRESNNQYYLDRNISISPANNGSAILRFYFTNSEFIALKSADPTVISPNDLQVNKTSTQCQSAFSTPSLTITQDANGTYGNDYYIQFPVTSFSTFFVNKTGTVLPVTLISFTAECFNEEVQLRWVTSQEKNIKSFTIEKSADGFSFETIQTVDAAVDSTGTGKYSFRDINSNQKNYYRLKLLDDDGKFIYSKVVTASCVENQRKVSIYPNPASDHLTVRLENPGRLYKVTITNAVGKKIYQKIINRTANTFTLDISDLKKGIYLLELLSDSELKTAKFIKQ